MAQIRHRVAMVTQQFSPVCWLACAAMVIQYKRHLTPDAVMLGTGGLDFRTPGLTVNRLRAWDARLRQMGFTVTGPTRLREIERASRSLETRYQSRVGSNEEILFRVLRDHGPVILSHVCGSFWYGPGLTPPPGGEHSVVVTGMDTDANRVWFNNPWGQVDVPTTTSSIVGAIERYERQGDPPFAYLK